MKFVSKKEARKNRGERPGMFSSRNVMNEPAMRFKIPVPSPLLLDAFVRCAEKFGTKTWYGMILKGGWPGVKGRVQLGVPTVDKFGEMVVVYRNDNGYLKSGVVGKVPHR